MSDLKLSHVDGFEENGIDIDQNELSSWTNFV